VSNFSSQLECIVLCTCRLSLSLFVSVSVFVCVSVKSEVPDAAHLFVIRLV